MTIRQLRSVPPQVLGRHVVVDPVVDPLERGQESLDAVDVCLPLDELQGALFDGLMGLRNVLVPLVLVGVDCGVGDDVVLDELLKGGLLGLGDVLHDDLVGVPVFDADDDGLSDDTSPDVGGKGLVLLFAADVSFIDLHGAG